MFTISYCILLWILYCYFRIIPFTHVIFNTILNIHILTNYRAGFLVSRQILSLHSEYSVL